jgi:hypothetical protein
MTTQAMLGQERLNVPLEIDALAGPG